MFGIISGLLMTFVFSYVSLACVSDDNISNCNVECEGDRNDLE